MFCHMKVQNAPTIMANDEEAAEHAECESWDGEEVHRCNGFSMIAQKREPALRESRISWRFAHPAGDGSFGDIESEHEKFPMNPWRSPGRILGQPSLESAICRCD
jgi:hypothetical protein